MVRDRPRSARVVRRVRDETVNDERWERDLRYHHLARHLRDTHGADGPPAGTRDRRHLLEELHQGLHDEGLCGHGLTHGLR